MCGIAGLIFDEVNPEGAAWLSAMARTMIHRGPDGGGMAVFGLGGNPEVHGRLDADSQIDRSASVPMQAGLAARRLAIIDRSDAGHQPMSHGKGQPCIVFNGVICNYRALRDELAADGMTFRGASDTEVLLAAYRRWGVDCARRLAGMWAFAIYDPAASRVLLCRDRWGIKPLYVARHARGITFASEIKAILTLPGFERATDAGMLRDFLAFGLSDHTSRTMFEGVWAVPPGCWMTFDLCVSQGRSAPRLERYWPEQGEFDAVHSASTSTDGILCALEMSVRDHLVSDVAVGSCLSGGLDSSTVVALTHRIVSKETEAAPHWSRHTITACLPGAALDERRYAEAVIRACPGLIGHFVEPTPRSLLDQMGRLVWHQEQPFGSPSIYMQWEVMRAAREAGVVVLLDGQGGDELFGGYEGMIPSLLADVLARGQMNRFAHEWKCARRAGWFGASQLAAHTIAALLPDRLRVRLRAAVARRRMTWLARELFDEDEPTEISVGLGALGYVTERSVDTVALGRFARHSWRLLLSESLPALLRFEDRNSMAHSIEARVPLLDHRMAAVAMRLPSEAKIRGGVLKAALRDAAADLLPVEVRRRRDKIGFAAPTAEWMRDGLSDWWRDLLASRSFHERGCTSRKGITRLVRRFDAGDASAALPIWRLAIVEEWARRLMDRSGAK